MSRITSLFFTGTAGGMKPVKQINNKIERANYESFPFCCYGQRTEGSLEREVNLSQRDDGE